jgi:hypothetical protein
MLGVASDRVDAQNQVAPDPYVIYHPNPLGTNTAIGWLYTPELLTELARRQPPDAVSPRILDAIKRELAIVVMWTIPPTAGEEPWPRPFQVAITDPGRAPGGERIDPVWIVQNAADLQALDPRTTFGEVGAMAAFHRAAFKPGRWIFIYRHFRPAEPGGMTGVERSGVLEWDGLAGTTVKRN